VTHGLQVLVFYCDGPFPFMAILGHLVHGRRFWCCAIFPVAGYLQDSEKGFHPPSAPCGGVQGTGFVEGGSSLLLDGISSPFLSSILDVFSRTGVAVKRGDKVSHFFQGVVPLRFYFGL